MRTGRPKQSLVLTEEEHDRLKSLAHRSRSQPLLARRARVVLAPSRDTAEHVAVQQGVPRERIRVLPWALDPQFEALLAAKPLPKPPKDFPAGRVILTTGRWVARRA